MKVFVVLYLFMGVVTCGTLTGRGIWPHESKSLVVGGNTLLLALVVIGFVHASRKGRFLGFDRWFWLVCTIGPYAAGAICNATLLSR